jgi:hypothetical protein
MSTRPPGGTRVLAVAALIFAVGTVVAFVGLLQALIPLRPAWYLGALTVATVLAAAAVWRARQWLPVTALVVAVLLLGGASAFHFIAMRVPATAPALVVGQPAPDFALPDAAGAEVLAISPDSNERSQELARRLRVHYRFLADPDLAVTRRLGLVHRGGGPGGRDVPRPATIVIDRDGIVRWTALADNVQVRPDPREVLRAVRAL